VSVNSLLLRPWIEALRPVRGKLTAPLATISREKSRSEGVRSQATDILTDYASDDPSLVADLLMDADPKAYAAFFPIAQREAAKAVPLFQAEITNGSTQGDEGVDSEQVRDRLAERRARAAVCLVRLGRAEAVWPLLRHSRDPRLRSYLINWLSPLGADPRTLAAELDRIALVPKPTPIRGQQAMDAVLFHPETSMRRALILALGQYDREALSAGEREPLIAKLLVLYENDPDAGIHGAAEWTLRKWGQQKKLNEIDTELMKAEDRGERRWYVNGQGQAFVLIEGPVEFDMGSPPTEWDRSTLHRRMIPRRFAIASKEVTIEQYQRFVRENPQFSLNWSTLKRYSPEPNGPMMEVSWYGAVAYCNWLSHREGLSKDQWCYLPNERGEYAQGMTIPADVHQRTGYRLPTEGEWEYACRAGTMTGRYYGVSTELLGSYAWYIANCREHAWPCGVLLPNDLGLFDMLGNVLEWCHGTYQEYQPGAATTTKEILNNNEHIDEKPPRLLRGGGSFDTRPGLVHSAFRFWYAPSGRDFNNGFRPARTYP
jgi:formylglycine-generating enzyme required for sulfatase activity